MKKFFAMAATALFFMTSCSSDDAQPTNSGTNPTVVLLKKTVETYEDGTTFTTNYNYDGNKIVSMVDSEGNTTTFTYTGDLITEIKHYEGETLFQKDVIEYNSTGKPQTSYMYLMTQNSSTKNNYTYNSNGTITVTSLVGDLETQTLEGDTVTLTVQNNNITSAVYSSVNESWTFTNTVDPRSNITGYMNAMISNFEGGYNNVATSNYSDSEGITENYTLSYTYGPNTYPATAVETDVDTEEVTTIQFFY